MKDKELELLVTENLNYVKSLAHQYRGKGVDYEDLVSEGYMAMVQASSKFDASRNTPFVAYAAPYIRKAMDKAVEQQANLYRVPKDIRKLVPRGTGKAVSIDAPLSIGNQYTLLDILANKDALMADNYAEVQQMLQDLQVCLDTLDSREKEVVTQFYGIGRSHHHGRNRRKHATQAWASTPNPWQGYPKNGKVCKNKDPENVSSQIDLGVLHFM